MHFLVRSATLFIERQVIMYTNIDKKHLLALCEREPEAQLIIDTMLENHRRIIGTIGHEIGNPLTYLYSSTQLLENEHEILKDSKHWLLFKDEVIFMKELLVQLSSYNNSTNLRMEEDDLSELLRTTVLSFASTCVDDDIEITSDIPTIPRIFYDKYKLKQVIMNLLKNGHEACAPHGKLHLIASFNSEEITISVKDNGCGIPSDILPHIFTPFKTFKEGGTGLGLAVTHEIITAHEGRIEVYSTEGEGTEFIISLPIQ